MPFSSNNGDDFRCVLEEVARISESSVTIPRPAKGKWGTSGVIVGDTWSIAWRTFDAQFWNVPQRRRRICLVADFDGHTAADIVFDQQHGSTLDNDDESLEKYFGVGCRSQVPSFCKSLSGHPHKSEQTREESSSTSGEGSDAGNCFCIQGSGLTSQQAHGSGVNEDVAFTLNATDQHGVAYTLQDREGAPGGGKGPLIPTDLASSLRTNNYMTVFQPVPEVFSAHGFVLSEAMNTLGTLTSEQNHHVRGDTSLVVEPVPFRKTAHPMNAEQAQGWEVATCTDTLNQFDISESRIPTVVVDEDRSGIVSERHDERGSQMTEDGVTDPLTASDYKQPITIAYAADKVGSLCYDDYKGANNQYVDQDKLLVLQEQEVISLGRDAIEQGKNAQWQPEIRNDGRRNTIIAKGVGGVSYEEPHIFKGDATDGGNCECAIVGGHDSTISDMTNVLVSNEPKYIVRRLTPLECERLQGLPDGWTDIGEYVDSKGKKCQTRDSHRYKALGNGIATPSWYWVLCRMSCFLGERPTLASLFSGIGSFEYLWEMINGKGTAIWCSEVDEFAIAVSKYHFPDESEVT